MCVWLKNKNKNCPPENMFIRQTCLQRWGEIKVNINNQFRGKKKSYTFMWILNKAKTFECCRWAVFLPKFCSSGKQNASQTLCMQMHPALQQQHICCQSMKTLCEMSQTCAPHCVPPSLRVLEICVELCDGIGVMYVRRETKWRSCGPTRNSSTKVLLSVGSAHLSTVKLFDLFLERGCVRDPLFITG